ncbi:hypothetical protein [Streptomyces resistomycificus]|nr:hypothetical protein [Streptomyces resistomycificus]
MTTFFAGRPPARCVHHASGSSRPLLIGWDLAQVLQGVLAGPDDSPVDLGAGEDLIGCGGVEPGLQDGRRVGVPAEFVIVEQPQHTVVSFSGRDGRRRVEEPVGAFDLLGDPGQLGGVQHMEDVGHGRVNPAMLRVAFQEPGWTVVVGVDASPN